LHKYFKKFITQKVTENKRNVHISLNENTKENTLVDLRREQYT